MSEYSPAQVGFRVNYDTWNQAGPPKDGLVAHFNGSRPLNITTTDGFLRHLRAVEDWHIDHNGWSGFAYGWAFGPGGEVARGRGFNLYAAHRGDSDQDGIPDNYEKIPFYFPVGGDEQPTPAMLAAANQKRLELEAQLGTPLPLIGHREVSARPCPGEPLMAWVKANRNSRTQGTPIIGPPSATLGQAVQWATKVGATRGFLDALSIAWTEAPRVGQGVDPVVAAAVMAWETDEGKYTGVVPVEFNNWGGIKTATGGDDRDPNAHARFPSRRAGVVAVLEHLHLYAYGPVPYPTDPRHFPYLAATAPTLEDPDYLWGHDGRKVAALVRAIQATQADDTVLWVDSGSWPSYARDAISWAIDRGLFLGHQVAGTNDREFRPTETVTRAQLAVVLQRLHLTGGGTLAGAITINAEGDGT